MAVRKVTSKKTGNGSRRTTTLSSTNGKTESYSNRPTKQSPRRTVSFNHKTGKTRTTYSQKLGGGYTRITSKTTGGSKPRKTKSSSKGNSSGVDTSLSFTLLLLILLCGAIMYLWPITIPYVIGTVVSIVAIIVIYELVCIVLPWVVLGGILYGLYYILKLFV